MRWPLLSRSYPREKSACGFVDASSRRSTRRRLGGQLFISNAASNKMATGRPFSSRKYGEFPYIEPSGRVKIDAS
jgi:hypothetical protein